MTNKIILICLLCISFLLSGCDTSVDYSDGIITVDFDNLSSLTGFSTTSSNIYCEVMEIENDSYITISGSYFEGTGSNPLYSSFYFGVGNPDYVFSGGTVYYIEIQIDIDGNDSFDDLNTDYWLGSLIEVVVDGNTTVNVDFSDFIYRF